jgi:hypothetical protein
MDNPWDDAESTFRFAPELFQFKADATMLLAEQDLHWLCDYSNIDVVHDLYGLDIEGIPNEITARKIHKYMYEHFQKLWGKGSFKPIQSRTYQDNQGWTVEVSKYPHPEIKSWLDIDYE